MKKNNISSKYHFSDFTVEHYVQLIKAAKENYSFVGYNDFDKNTKFVIWRHDIDFSPHRALRLAEIEKEEGVRTTYFIHLHNEFYNIFEKKIFDIIKKIIYIGHDIGIHFDTHFYDINTEEAIENNLHKEKNILQELFDVPIHSFSFHNTNAFIMSCRKWKYAGLVNAYAEYFQKDVTYCSDSNGYWRYQRMHDVIIRGNAQRLHLLTHPEWWQEEIMSPYQKIERAIQGRAEKNRKYYKDLLAASGMKNIDWKGII